VNQFNIKVLAQQLGVQDEYDLMFKFSSKFVHPSAVLVNKRIKGDDADYANMFLIRAQEYSLQLLAGSQVWVNSHLLH